MNKHRVSLQLIFIYTKLFGVFSYLCDIASQWIDGVLFQVNFTVSQVDSWTQSVIIFSVPESRVGWIYLLTCRILSWFPNVSVDYHVRKEPWNCHLPYFSHLRQIVIKVGTAESTFIIHVKAALVVIFYIFSCNSLLGLVKKSYK